MGLPTKQQKKKHKRGARKALETLEILNAEDQPPVKKIKTSTNTKSKKTSKKSSSGENIDPNSVQPNTNGPDEKLKIPNSINEPAVTDQVLSKVEKVKIVTEELEGDEVVNQKIKLDPKLLKNEESQRKIQKNIQSDTDSTVAVTEKEEDTQQDKFLTFCIGSTDYGTEIRFITEIIVIQKITAVPDTAQFIRGVINLRGKVIPVMDVRERFGLEKREYDDRTCIIVVNHNDISVGLIVDTVNEVVDISASDIDPPPTTHSGIKADYIAGMGKMSGSVKILINLQNVLDIGGLSIQHYSDSPDQAFTAI